MDNITKETKKIYNLVEKYAPVRPSSLVVLSGLSTKNLYKHLARLNDNLMIQKTGQTPSVYYSPRIRTLKLADSMDEDYEVVEKNYIFISPSGEIARGMRGFKLWCKNNHFDFKRQKKSYINGLKKINKMKKHGLISFSSKIRSRKFRAKLDASYCSDFYTFDHFGKTKLGQLVYVGKTSQNKGLIFEITEIISPAISYLIKKYNIGFVGYIPPTIDRKVQFMDVLREGLNIDLPEIKIAKVPTPTKVAQKTLRRLEDRIYNAEKTIAVDPAQKITANVLLIDDAMGSGATLNITTKKIKNIAKSRVQVIGYSVIGSYKGFDVISEV